jgi:hypothetical protein
MEVGVIGQQKEVKITSSKLFFQWQQVHGSNSLPGGLLKALGFENWEHFLECHLVFYAVRQENVIARLG